ncbi:hypothetical protein BS17DRAFT_766236 [Gyrodon lividus]|nr:hypothetical protein BS17DRAFT_766236 [Gyrodon lividus]
MEGQGSPHMSPASSTTSRRSHQCPSPGGRGQGRLHEALPPSFGSLPWLSSNNSLISPAPSHFSFRRWSNNAELWEQDNKERDDYDDCDDNKEGGGNEEEEDSEDTDEEMEGPGPDMKLWMALLVQGTRVAPAYAQLLQRID